jgi:hypothetical protein
MRPPATYPVLHPQAASFGIAATIVVIPGGVALLDTGLAAVLYTAELVLLLIVFLTALFAPARVSERAFRLLRWMTGNPEPPVTLTGPDLLHARTSEGATRETSLDPS